MKTTEIRKMVWSLSGLVGLAIGYSLVIHWQYNRRLKTSTSFVPQVDDIFRSRAATGTPEKGSDPLETFNAAFDMRMDGKEPPPPLPPDEPVPAAPPPKEKLQNLVEVTGIFRRSISYYPKKKPRPETDLTVDVGQKFKELEEATLKAILVKPRPIRVLVHWQGEDVILECGEEEKERTRTVMVSPGGGSPAGFKGPAGSIQAGGREPDTIVEDKDQKGLFTIPRKEQDYLLENMETLIGDLQTREERDSSDKPAGVRIQKLKENSYLTQLGAREGDIVVSVNGVRVTSREQIVNHFRQNPVPPTTTQVPVVIIREGQRLEFNYRLPQ